MIEEPIPFASWDSDSRAWDNLDAETVQRRLFFAQNKNKDVCYVTKRDDQFLNATVINSYNGERSERAIRCDGPFGSYMLAGIEKKSADP